MNHGPVLFFGILFSLALSWFGLVFGSYHQLNKQMPAPDPISGRNHPHPQPGQAAQGEMVYKANGCVACHTQQAQQTAGDLKRGYGQRLSVARDYLYQGTVQLGHNRIGPDLANMGARTPEHYAFPWRTEVHQADTNAFSPEQASAEVERVQTARRQEIVQWHLLHLYNPQITSPGSTMPGYPFLFKVQPIGREPSPAALELPDKFSVEPGYEVVPTEEAHSLVAYLLNARADVPLFEAPIVKPRLNRLAETNPPPAAVDTNAPGANTNAPVGGQPKAP